MTEYSFFPGAASLSVAEIASLTGAQLREGADPARRLTGIAPVDVAEANDLTFVDSAKFTTPLATTRAGAVFTTERFARHVPDSAVGLCVRKPYPAFVARGHF